MKVEKLELINKKRIALNLSFAGAILGTVTSIIINAFVGADAFLNWLEKAFYFLFSDELGNGNVNINMNAMEFVLMGALIGAFTVLFTFAIALSEKDKETLHLIIKISDVVNNRKSKKSKITLLSRYILLKISEVFFSPKTQKEIFQPIVADWQEEYFEALFKKEIWKAPWINVRYTYAFLAAMWMKSPIGDLIQFVIKIAKQ